VIGGHSAKCRICDEQLLPRQLRIQLPGIYYPPRTISEEQIAPHPITAHFCATPNCLSQLLSILKGNCTIELTRKARIALPKFNSKLGISSNVEDLSQQQREELKDLTSNLQDLQLVFADDHFVVDLDDPSRELVDSIDLKVGI
jgi:hypothetical protein